MICVARVSLTWLGRPDLTSSTGLDRQVEMKVTSMNRGDCFILDTADTIYVWAGPKSRRTERLKATQAAAQIRDSDHGGKATIHILGEAAAAANLPTNLLNSDASRTHICDPSSI